MDKSSSKTSDEETDIMKELNEAPPEMDAVSQTLNISTNELFDIIDQYGLLNNSGTKSSHTDNDNNNNDHNENDLDIDLDELDKCESDNEK